MEIIRNDGSTSKDGINNNTYRILFSDFSNLTEDEQMKLENVEAYSTIGFYTMYYERVIFIKLLQYFFSEYLKRNFSVDLKRVHYNAKTKSYEYHFDDKVLTFDMISSHIFEERFQKILKSPNRFNDCHLGSLGLAINIKGAKVVTGYATILNQKVLHSVVEYESKDGPMILDYTMNLRTTKEDYYNLVNFQEIASIKGDEVKKDLDVMIYLGLGIKAGVLFHEEIMRDMQKNEFILATIPKEGRQVAYQDESEKKVKIKKY